MAELRLILQGCVLDTGDDLNGGTDDSKQGVHRKKSKKGKKPVVIDDELPGTSDAVNSESALPSDGDVTMLSTSSDGGASSDTDMLQSKFIVVHSLIEVLMGWTSDEENSLTGTMKQVENPSSSGHRSSFVCDDVDEPPIMGPPPKCKVISRSQSVIPLTT